MLRTLALSDSVFPSAIGDPNAIRSVYKTQLLYPAMGPEASTSLVFRFSRRLRHLSQAASTLTQLRLFQRQYKTIPNLVKARQILDPRVRNPGGYAESFIKSVRQHPLLEPLGQINAELLSAVAPTNNLGARRRLVSSIATTLSNHATLASSAMQDNPEILKSIDGAVLLRAFSMPNVVFEDMYRAGALKSSGPIIEKSLLMSNEPAHQSIIALLVKTAPGSEAEEATHAAHPLVRMALRRVARYHGDAILKDFDANPRFRRALTNYAVASLGAHVDFPSAFDLFPGRFPPLDGPNDDILGLREWSFQRTEELTLGLGKPELRGPIGAISISPRSEFKRTDTESHSSREMSSKSNARQTRLTDSRQVISASTFSSALDGLTESGIADAGEFSLERTVLSTLNEERRTVIDSIVKEISEASESSSVTVTEHSLGRSIEYRTEGKDKKLSTTELSFQVVVPTQVTVRLRDMNLAWCPRVPLPFAPLRDNVRKHEEEQRVAYVTQYYVPLPVKPTMKSEVIKSVEFQFYMRGRKNLQKKDFTWTLDTYDGAFVDLNEITVKHRNGGWDDAEELPGYGDIPYNWDDLEDARVYLENLSIGEDGKTLSGTGILETHDPEYFNVSWLVVTVPIRSYTDESETALANYEQALVEKDMKVQAIASRAVQFARMKRDELIEKYQRELNFPREAFLNLVRRLCTDVPITQVSYFEEVLSRCMDWTQAKMNLESEDMADLPFREFAPDHFMNTPGARFILPIHKGSEDLFFKTIERIGHAFFDDSATLIRSQLQQWRESIATMKAEDDPRLVLDSYETETVIGQHLEAIVSESEFASSPI
jgi:hypothetical protein